MKLYQIWIIVLKISMIIQIALILGNKHTEDDIVYLITDMLFKTSLGIFLIFYFSVNSVASINGWDKLFIEFGGVLLMFDAWYDDFPKILEKYGIYFNPYTLTIKKPVD